MLKLQITCGGVRDEGHSKRVSIGKTCMLGEAEMFY